MYKKILLLIILITPLTLTFSQPFFNPFQYGIKTVEKVEIGNENLRKAVREKAAELLNNEYKFKNNTTTEAFEVQGEEIKSKVEGVNVNKFVDEHFDNWTNLIIQAGDLVLSDCELLRSYNLVEYCHWKTVRADIQGGKLQTIYIAPSGYSGPFPRVAVCEQGIGQCLLFFFDRALRILYFSALALGVIFLMWAGILYITKPLEAKNIHQRFVWGIIGIVVGITSFTIVIALENWLAGGLATEVATEGGQVVSYQPGPGTESASPGGQPLPRLFIDTQTAKIDESKKFSVFVSAEKQCDLSASFYNLTKGEDLGSTLPISISAPQYFNFNLGGFGSKFDLGDTVRVIFNSQNCEVSVKQLDIRTSKLVTTVPTIKKPIIDIDSSKIKIYGQQTINVNIEDLGNLRNILEQALGITVIQRNLYDPPFTMYITYNVTSDNQPPLNQGSCTIYGTLRGVKINQLSFDRTKAVSYTTFNKDFSFTINYEANRKGPYNIPIYLPLPNNLLGFIYLKLYYYRGDCEEVKVNGQNIAESPFSTTYDIETGRFYSVSGNLLRDLFGF
jgi:hypothetical protein